ncbi:MAG: transaldolase family protein [Acidiferrobacterales bacterium]
MPHLFLDTANIDDIRFFSKSDAIAGVTTNPSLMAKEKKGDYISKLQEIASILSLAKQGGKSKHLSVEVTTLDPDGMVTQALNLQDKLVKSGVDLHIKIPVLPQTLQVITLLSKKNIRVNATACMTALQGKLASDAGAPIVSFFFNRMIDGLQEDQMRIFDNASPRSRALTELVKYKQLGGTASIICGSIRKPEDVFDCWNSGAQIVTAGPKIIREMLKHPQTDKAVQQFQEDIEKWLS